jgi:hypothetical protein
MELAFLAYPNNPKVTDLALQKVEELGGTDYLPSLGGWKGQLLYRLFGWKGARKLSVRYHEYISALKKLVIS